ncbi:MAG: chemotaxis protein CheW, partial [Pseudomonadota bacterium]
MTEQNLEAEILEHQELELANDEKQLLIFKLLGNEYGFDIMLVREIKSWQGATRIPNSPNFVKGVMNLRGVIIPIFDLAKRFGYDHTEVNTKNVVIVIKIDEYTIGFLVDIVSDIISINKSKLDTPTSNNESAIDESFVEGLLSYSGRIITILNVNKLFDKETIKNA